MDNNNPNNTLSIMTYRNMFIILGLLMLFCSLLAFLPRNYILQQFEFFQKTDIERNVRIVHYALQAEEQNLNIVCRDWAHWDDIYQFVQDNNRNFSSVNLQMENLKETTNFDLFMLYNSDKQLLWGDIHLTESDAGKSAYPDSLQEEINLLVNRSYIRQVSGYMLTDNGLMLLSICPVLPSSGKGQAQGTLVTGRFFNGFLLQNISKQTQLALQLPNKSNIYSSVEKDILTHLQTDEHMLDNTEKTHPVVYMAMEDFYGEQFLISFTMPQTIMIHGTKAANYVLFATITAIVLLVIALATIFIIHTSVLNRRRQELALLLKKRSQELLESEERYQRLFNNADDAIYTIDLDFTLLDANRNTYERL
ncbi:MAG: CHASE4 domain-containing protein, partial [Syntrophomonadaceae bacterium]|nr:CHASE4 domain-containing protein [Syntrophomonadaceae bacterium]